MKNNKVEGNSNNSSSRNKIYSRIGKLINIIDNLKEVGCLSNDYILEIPKICVIGPPSSGKSSIIESIIGIDFLPKGDNLVTKRPIEINLQHLHDPNARTYVEFKYEDNLSGKKFENFSDVKNQICELIKKKCGDVVNSGSDKVISKDPIKLTIFSHCNPDMTIIDLPGCDDSIKFSKDLIFNYIKDESSLIVYVHETNSDLFIKNFSNNSTDNLFIKLIKECDKEFRRTISVLTKVDLLTQDIKSGSTDINLNLVKKLITSNYKIENDTLHVVVIKNRSANDQNSIEDSTYKEKGYFNSHTTLRSVFNSENFTLEALIDRLRKIIYSDEKFKKLVRLMHKSLKDKTQECQKELLKFGTDYIGYTNDTKNTYTTSLINNFCESIEKLFSGKMSDTNETLSSHKLKKVYYDFLNEYIQGYNPSNNIKNEEIIKIIKLTEGDRLSGFPESEVIYTLLEKDTKNLQENVKNYIDTVNDITRDSVKETIIRIFCRFPKLMNKVEELMNVFLEEFILKNYEKMVYLVNSVCEMNFNYLYMDDKSLSYNELLKKFVLTTENDNLQTRERSNTIRSTLNSNSDVQIVKDRDSYYNGLAEYVKILINHFFTLMLRNLREAIPKITGYYFINTLKQNLRFYLLTEITKDFSHEDLLEEDPEVAKNRNYFINLMKILKNCDKQLQYDEEIKIVIRGDNNKSINQVVENMKNKQLNDSDARNYVNPSDTNLINEKRGSSNFNPNSFFREESKVNNDTKTALTSSTASTITTSSTTNTNVSTNSNQNKFVPINNSTSNLPKEDEQKLKKEPAITFKMDPNSQDIKDMKINVNMDAETALNFYQTNKKYLPTTQQVVNGAKSTANYIDKNSSFFEEDLSAKDTIITGSKVPTKKGNIDPLTSLFGTTKKETKPGNITSNSTTNPKKGMF